MGWASGLGCRRSQLQAWSPSIIVEAESGGRVQEQPGLRGWLWTSRAGSWWVMDGRRKQSWELAQPKQGTSTLDHHNSPVGS